MQAEATPARCRHRRSEDQGSQAEVGNLGKSVDIG